MPNEEVLGPRKTMFVLVIVVGCFAVLWPRILSPLILGQSRDQLKPNAFDREAGCCEVMFETELAVLELINEVCSSAVHVDGKLSPYAAVECRKAVNETCGLDIAAFLKRTENIGQTSRKLVETMKNSNSSCLKEHFGVPVWSLGPHQALNSWTLQDTVKQERPSPRAGPHPALRERGRAIPPGAAPPRTVTAMPPHVRVRSPLSVYYELDIKPPPIPGMRPPLGSPGGPVPTPKSSMGFVMPIYTICIIVFFVYTLSKILFKRTASPYEPVTPDPQFRSRVFRDDSRSSPDKLVVTAISGLVAEVQQQMDASYAQNQQRQEASDNAARPFTNGTILHSTGPVHIVASEYREASKEKSPEPEKEPSEPEKVSKQSLGTDEVTDKHESEETKTASEETKAEAEVKDEEDNEVNLAAEDEAIEESGSEPELIELNHKEDLTVDDGYVKVVEDFLKEECDAVEKEQSTQDLLEEAIKEDSPEKAEYDQENATVKMVVSGKMTLSLIQDVPRETPEKDPESTVDDFTTASAITQPAVEKQADEESEEEIEIEEEIEVEEIEEEVDEEIEEIEEDEPEVKETVEVKDPVKVDEVKTETVQAETAKVEATEGSEGSEGSEEEVEVSEDEAAETKPVEVEPTKKVVKSPVNDKQENKE